MNEESSSSDNEPDMKIFVRFPDGIKVITLEVSASDTINNIKGQIQAKEKVKPKQQRLLFGIHELSNNETLKHYDIQNESYIRLMLRGDGGVVKGTKKDMTMKKQAIMNAKPIALSSDNELITAVTQCRNIEQLQNYDVATIFGDMTLDSLNEIKNMMRHSKATVDAKLQQMHTFTTPYKLIKGVIDSMQHSQNKLHKIIYESMVVKFVADDGSFKSQDIMMCIEVAIDRKEQGMAAGVGTVMHM